MSRAAWQPPGGGERPAASDLAENKREMFDGMRAYHQSEISHANHAITMLLAIAGAAGAAVLAILFPESPPPYTNEIAWGLGIAVTVLALTIATTTHIKISGDHRAYASYGDEYVKTARLLGFYDDVVPIKNSSRKATIKTNPKIGHGKGYRRTQFIIWSFSIVLIALTWMFASFLSRIEVVPPQKPAAGAAEPSKP
jgi:hypothetical protein